MTAPWLAKRQRIAQQTAAGLADQYPDAEIWLVGALAEHLAHTHSDIDLLVVVPTAEPPALRSRLVADIRVDLRAVAATAVDEWRELLADFTVTRDDVETFRRVRAHLPDLTLLRTARQMTSDGTAEVLEPALRNGYRRWALADRCEAAASLAEDLVGLIEAGLYRHADLVWDRLTVILAQAETVAADAPLLGEKWLPSLLMQHYGADEDAPVPTLPVPDWPHAATSGSPWFASVQVRLATALLSLWPLTSTTPPHPLEERGLAGFGWLPQRYTDGWFLRRGDVRVPLSEGELHAWRDAVARQTRS